MVEYLLDQGTLLTKYLTNEYATKLLLDKAVINKNFKLVAHLLNQGVCISPNAEKCISEKHQELFQAILQDDLDTVRTLIKQGLSINTYDKQRNTLLHKAVASGNTYVFKYLLALLHKVDTDKMHNYLLKKIV